jgi:hypothetical protein
MLAIDFGKDRKSILPEQEYPKFYLCERFFTNEVYRKSSKLSFDEIVSINHLLFPGTEKIWLDEKSAKLQDIEDGKKT